jgi:hypothetical protein
MRSSQEGHTAYATQNGERRREPVERRAAALLLPLASKAVSPPPLYYVIKRRQQTTPNTVPSAPSNEVQILPSMNQHLCMLMLGGFAF